MRRWHTGWRRTRGLPAATEQPDGVLCVAVGTPGRGVEQLVLDGDAHPRRIDAAATAALGLRDPWVTVPTLRPGHVADRLVEHRLRIALDSERLMSVELAAQRRLAAAPGWRADLERAAYESSEVWRLRLLDGEGRLAARGEVAVVGDVAVVDRVETESAYRRRGLGGAVMSRLADLAESAGATRGLLMASPAGQSLYSSLGWQGHDTVVVARLP